MFHSRTIGVRETQALQRRRRRPAGRPDVHAHAIDVVHTGSQPASGHRLRASHCRIVDNDTRLGSGGPVYTFRLRGVGANGGAEVALENSLLARNCNHGFNLALTLSTGSGGRIVLTGSTIAANPICVGTAAITLQTFSGVSGIDFVVMNNIAWHNGATARLAPISTSTCQMRRSRRRSPMRWPELSMVRSSRPPPISWSIHAS